MGIIRICREQILINTTDKWHANKLHALIGLIMSQQDAYEFSLGQRAMHKFILVACINFFNHFYYMR